MVLATVPCRLKMGRTWIPTAPAPPSIQRGVPLPEGFRIPPEKLSRVAPDVEKVNDTIDMGMPSNIVIDTRVPPQLVVQLPPLAADIGMGEPVRIVSRSSVMAMATCMASIATLVLILSEATRNARSRDTILAPCVRPIGPRVTTQKPIPLTQTTVTRRVEGLSLRFPTSISFGVARLSLLAPPP